MTALDRGDLDALYEAQKRHAPGQLGDNATKEFVLRHVFEIAPELIKQPSDLLRVLLRRHYRGQRIPTVLDERFIQLLRQSNAFDDWPLETLVADREAFFAFLQERWPIFLDREAAKGTSGVREDEKPYGLAIEGPVDLPFDHHDIRVYIDNLFVEGLLHSVSTRACGHPVQNLGRHRRSNRSNRGQVSSPGQAHRQPADIHSGRGRKAHGLVPLCPWMGGD